MSWWQGIGYRLLLWSCQGVGLLPLWFLYGVLGRFMYVALYYVFGYRIKVVRANLSNSFPEKSAEELKQLEKEYYRHLAELFIDTIDISSITRKQLKRRIRIIGLEQHEAQVRGRDWIAAMSHYGSWEYFIVYQLLTPAQVVGVYHPLENVVFERFFKYIRSRFGSDIEPAKTLMRYVMSHRGSEHGVAIGLIADQIPPWHMLGWFDFLNQPTHFYEGLERLSVRFGMPVYFLHMEKISSAHYHAHFELLYDGVSPVQQDEITARYAAMLEKEICQSPPYWMWSHRRWKSKPHEGEPIKKLPEL